MAYKKTIKKKKKSKKNKYELDVKSEKFEDDNEGYVVWDYDSLKME